MSTPDFFGAFLPSSRSQKKPLATTMRASAALSFRCATATISLRKASKLGSLSGAGSVTASGLYGLGAAGCCCCCCGGAFCAWAAAAGAQLTSTAAAKASETRFRWRIILPPIGLVSRTRSSHKFAASPIANSGFKRGTRIITLRVPLGFRRSPGSVLQGFAEFRNRDTSRHTPDAASTAIRSVAAPDIADDAPATRLLAVAEPVGIRRQQRVRCREAGLSARGGHACPGIARRVGIAVLFLEAEHADEVQTERLGNRGIGLGGRPHLEAGRAGIIPFEAVALGAFDELTTRVLVELRNGRGANHRRPAGQGTGAGLGRKGGERIPAAAVIRVEAQRGREIVDARPLGIEAADEVAFREAIFGRGRVGPRRVGTALGDLAEVLAQRVEGGVAR